MLPTVFLLLSVFTVRGSACDELRRETVSNLQDSIKHEEQSGFPSVFPKNYYVQHHFNGSTQCEDSVRKCLSHCGFCFDHSICCVFSAAFLLSDSWKQLLQHIERIHMKHGLIGELIITLDTIWTGGFQETPNPSGFPSVHSSPRALLTITSDVLSKWLTLNCPVGTSSCIFPSPAPLFTGKKEKQEKEHSIIDGGPASEYRQGEREKLWLTVVPKNGAMGLSASPTFFLCILCCLRMLLDVMLKELG